MSDPTHAHQVNTALVETEAARIAELLDGLRGDDWTTPAPTCPGWTLRNVARHVGTSHRWATAMVDRLVPDRLSPRTIDMGLPKDSDDLPAWVAAGAAELVATLRRTEGEAPMWAWGADQHAGFWSRRMLHETAVHGVDLQIALGLTPECDTAVAVDGVDEFLENLPYAAAFEPKVRRLTGDGETLHLHATDEPAAADSAGAAEWLITLEHDGFRWSRAHARGAVAVRGSVSDLYLFTWGRRKSDWKGIEVVGDETLLDHWVQNASF